MLIYPILSGITYLLVTSIEEVNFQISQKQHFAIEISAIIGVAKNNGPHPKRS